MAHTYTDLLFHIVFSTKERRPLLTLGVKPKLLAYMAGICENLKCKPHIINGPEDHIHGLILLSSTISVADFINKLKSNSSKWANEHSENLKRFAWQTGYSAFSVSRSNFEAVYKYIANQEEHHKKMSFKDELIVLLKKHGIEYDERYIGE